MDDEVVEMLEGRIVALEQFNRIVMSAVVGSQPDRSPIDVLDGIERDLMSTLQRADRPIGAYADRVWEHAVDSLRAEFANIRARLED